MKTLATENPSLVRLIVLPNKTWQGREVLGIEIAENVAANDGRPAFLNMGVHHAREWPAGEHAMEWAYELIKGFKAGDARATNIVRNSRNLVVPIVNPDGFNGSARLDAVRRPRRDDRRHRLHRHVARRVPAQELPRRGHRDRVLPRLHRPGRERRRPEPQLRPVLGRPGLRHQPGDPDLPRPGAVLRARVAQHPVARLPQPGDVADHQPHHCRTRAARARAWPRSATRSTRTAATRRSATRWPSTTATSARRASSSTTRPVPPRTGATTPPAGSASRSRSTAARRTTSPATATRPRSTRATPRWPRSGTARARRPTTSTTPPACFDGKGNREAYYLAAESAIDEARHSIIEGSAPAGTKLRLTKDFKTETFPQNGTPLQVDDHLETVYDVGATGAFKLAREPVHPPAGGQGDGLAQRRRAERAADRFG